MKRWFRGVSARRPCVEGRSPGAGRHDDLDELVGAVFEAHRMLIEISDRLEPLILDEVDRAFRDEAAA